LDRGQGTNRHAGKGSDFTKESGPVFLSGELMIVCFGKTVPSLSLSPCGKATAGLSVGQQYRSYLDSSFFILHETLSE